jgi:hypothetical protein
MPWTTRLLMVAAVLGLATMAHAETSSVADQRYCTWLSDLYVRYFGWADGSPTDVDFDGDVARAKCEQGEAADVIPILERKLRDAGYSLPPRR